MPEEEPAASSAPFIPRDADAPPMPPAPWRLFGSKSFFRLWLAEFVSSLGDWIGLIAILAIAARVSNNSGAAVSLVMVTRVVPGFFLGTVGGVIIDKFDRRKVMVSCDIGRSCLLLALPFMESLPGLVLISLGLEVLTLLWGPAQAATVPNLVREEQLSAANSLSLAASYGTFPIASIIFSLLAGFATVLGELDLISAFKVDQEFLALVFDAMTFLVSAAIVWRLPIPRRDRPKGTRIDWTETFRDIKEGLVFIRQQPLVRGVIIGLGFGIIGGGRDDPARSVVRHRSAGRRERGVRCVDDRARVRRRVRRGGTAVVPEPAARGPMFAFAVLGVGAFLVLAASCSSVAPAVLFIGAVGACAGTSYVTGFTLLQENSSDEIRGRTFATLYTVIRLCLLISLTISPLWADFWDWVTNQLFTDQTVVIGSISYVIPGVRIALWGGGLIAYTAGIVALRSVRRAATPRRG